MSIQLATSYSKLLPLTEFPANPQWTVLSTHRHACNLVATDGTLVALVNETHGNGPFHIVVSGIDLAQLPRTASVQWRGTQLQLAHITIDLRSATPWEPHLPQLIHLPPEDVTTQFAILATTRSALYSGSPALTLHAQRGVYTLRQGLTACDEMLTAQGAALLAGLGPGLTPAGDDFLVGMLAGIWARYRADVRYQTICATIATIAAGRTTRLSGNWLAHAGNGAFGERWHDLVNTANRADPAAITQALQMVLRTGASSGADALCGFFAAILD